MSATVCHGMRRSSRRRPGGIRRFLLRGGMVSSCALLMGTLLALNWTYQVIRKPVEVFAPVSPAFSKGPEATWESYGPLFEKFSTSSVSPEFLAALAQLEGDGNPLARTYWRWRWSLNPFDIYGPASSAVGMFQMTDGTFAAARRYCIRDHRVVADGPWYDPHSCWFNGLYTRIIPRHSVEMTAAYLHRTVGDTLAAHPRVRASPAQKEKLAAVIHLCGVQRGATLVGRGFRAVPGERCGTHSLTHYLHRVFLMKQRFARLRGIASSSGVSHRAVSS